MRTVSEVLKKLKTGLPYDSAIPFLEVYLKNSTNLKRYMNPNVHRSIKDNCQDKEATWVSINRWMGKEEVCVCIYTYKQWDNHSAIKKERNFAICKMDGLQEYYAKWNKSYRGRQVL